FFGGGDSVSNPGRCGLIHVQHHACFLQTLEYTNASFFRVFMEQNGFCCVTDRRTVCFGVEDDIHGFLRISGGIHKHVTHPGAGLNDRYGGIVNDRPNQAGTTAWDEDVDSPTIGHQSICAVASPLIDTLDEIRWESTRFKCVS